MSSMEFFVGTFEKAPDQSIFPVDEDDFYDLEQEHGCYYIRVDDVLYKVTPESEHLDEFGFQTVIEPKPGPLLLCYWYNGGAGLHEVAEEAIQAYLEKQKEPQA